VRRAATRVGERAVEDPDGVRIDVAGVAAAGLVWDLESACRRRTVLPVAEPERRAVVLVDENKEVPVVGALKLTRSRGQVSYAALDLV
jgi:hypothetical protein